jgi:hypothetical protein
MTRLVPLALGAALLLLAACAEPAPPPPPAAPPPTAPPPPTASRDECGADDYQRLVGQPRSKIPVPVNPALQRVACTTCPVTMDFVPRRLNFLFDAETGLIREVKCG